MNNSNDRQSTTAFLSLSGPQLPVDLEFNPHHLPDIFRKHHLPLGRCFGSKSAYREANTKCEFVPNANVISKRDGKVWWGDLDLVRDSAVLEKIARLLRCRLYVLGEHDGRFDKAARPHLELIRDAVWHTGGASHVPGARLFLQRSGLSRAEASVLLKLSSGRLDRRQPPEISLEIGRRLRRFEDAFRPIGLNAGHAKWGSWWKQPHNKLTGRSPLQVLNSGGTLDLGTIAKPTVGLMLFAIGYGVMESL
jgi:hypothetical protein